MTIHPKTCTQHHWVCYFTKYICFWCGADKQSGDKE